MRDFIANCPWCGTRSVAFTVRGKGNEWSVPIPDYKSRAWVACDTFAVCGKCTRGIMATFIGNELSQMFPSPPEPPAHVPKNVELFFKQATNNLPQDWDAAGVMFRKTLEAALKDKFTSITGTLSQRINEAAKQQKLTPELAQWAHQIRLDGNDAVHGDTPLSKEDAQSLADFTNLVLLYLYTLPGMLAQAQAPGATTPSP